MPSFLFSHYIEENLNTYEDFNAAETEEQLGFDNKQTESQTDLSNKQATTQTQVNSVGHSSPNSRSHSHLISLSTEYVKEFP